ncbi:MAG: hypothetical protein JXB88_19365 [Spirochaetales bacterium]|nr:hypothetical protein [Spirochaetales bacterium]
MALGQIAARTEGDIYQAHIFWYYAAKLLDDNQNIEEVSFEYDQIAGVDDICIKYKGQGILENEQYYKSDFIQVKYHVDKRNAYSSDNLCDPVFNKNKGRIDE